MLFAVWGHQTVEAYSSCDRMNECRMTFCWRMQTQGVFFKSGFTGLTASKPG